MILNVSLSDEELATLERVAAKEGRAPEQVARTAILEYASGWSRERDRLLDSIVNDDTKTLRRLGSA